MVDREGSPVPPDAPQVPFVREFHGDRVEDPYHWMADKSDQRFLDYLAAENAYTDAMTAHLGPLREDLFEDISSRTKQTDLSVPGFITHVGGRSFWYYTRTTEGLDYQAHYRLPATDRDHIPEVTHAPAGEQLVLDVNQLAQGTDFLALGLADLSPDGNLIAYSTDTEGDERFDLYVMDVDSREVVAGPIEGVGGGGTWITDEYLLYLRIDDSWRPHEVWRHRLGTPVAEDVLVYREDDERFFVSVDASRDRAFALIEVASKITGETHLIPAADPTAGPRCVGPRRDGVDYTVEVAPDGLYIVHNADHPQFSLSKAPLDASSPADWHTILAGSNDRRLLSVAAYARGLVVSHRTAGLSGVAFLRSDADGSLGPWQDLSFNEPLYAVDADADPDFHADRFRLSYESMVTPLSVLECRLDSLELTTLKRTPVLDHPRWGAYDPSDYVQERLWAQADDGTAVPLSVVRRRDTALDGTAPGLLYGYGAYEVSMDPFFSIARLSLLDRGFVYAIAHVRGGGELGRPWYEQGRLQHKRNTFTDFLACARTLLDGGHVAPGRLIAEGGSAGGLLMGAVLNLGAELFCGVHAAVPFVDALTTILNPELPLTVVEWDEWGDPLHDADAYAYLKSYSPYENVAPGRRPALLVTAGLHDTRVEVTEPGKWVARLRDLAVADTGSPILLKTEMASGHGGVSARYQAWRDRAFELAWMIDLVAR
ncbi:MAG TPA: S9 family peptidase [Propioniciclava tarda]|nr:S9 family peptidase [Propioniciclava tarda]